MTFSKTIKNIKRITNKINRNWNTKLQTVILPSSLLPRLSLFLCLFSALQPASSSLFIVFSPSSYIFLPCLRVAANKAKIRPSKISYLPRPSPPVQYWLQLAYPRPGRLSTFLQLRCSTHRCGHNRLVSFLLTALYVNHDYPANILNRYSDSPNPSFPKSDHNTAPTHLSFGLSISSFLLLQPSLPSRAFSFNLFSSQRAVHHQ